MSDRRGRGMRFRIGVAAAALIWALVWLGVGWSYMLDDALIHLRYAHNLLSDHTSTFNRDGFSIGCSSPLYLWILAAGSLVTDSLWLPKAVSVAAYAGLLGLIVWQWLRAAAPVGWLWGALLIACCGPAADRWLANGMETSLTMLLAMLAALATPSLVVAPEGTAAGDAQPLAAGRKVARYLWLCLLGFLLVASRVEAALLILAASLFLVIWRGSAPPGSASLAGRLRAFAGAAVEHSHLAVGGLAALATIWLEFGAFVSDAGLAKQSGPQSIGAAIWAILWPTATSMTFGLGLLAVWLVSLAMCGLLWPGRRVAVLAANVALPLLALGVARTGQGVVGVRYVAWLYLFQAAFNLELARLAPEAARQALATRVGRRAPLALAGLAAVVWAGATVYESRRIELVIRADGGRLVDMAADDLSALSRQKGIAYDVGFIGYLTDGVILDMNGLINGREVSRLSLEERARRFAAESPQFVFLTPDQVDHLAQWFDLRDFLVWRVYELPGTRYYLGARRSLVEEKHLAGATTPILEAVESRRRG